jgi:hypothetical protein
MARFAIASAGDDKYIAILQGLIRSIRAVPQGAGVPIVVLDLGFGANSLAWLAGQGVRCVVPDWDHKFNGIPPTYYKAMVSRPHLPKYVDEGDTIVWLDADTWIQDWSAIDLLLQGADASGFAIVPELDRSYSPMYGEHPYLSSLFDWYKRCFDEETARRLYVYPLLNCGVFAAKVNAPHWRSWAELMAQSLERAILFVNEQTALNVLLHSGRVPVSLLPAACNWICARSQPFVSEDGRTLLEPQIPHAPLGIVHLAGYDYNTKDRLFTLSTPGGGKVERALLYAGP